MKKQILAKEQRVRSKCLFRAFSDINDNFSDWYRATQLDIYNLESELAMQLLPR